ncbi:MULTISPECIES: chemotaxis protein CheD [Methylomonas]|uniref:chemotaxis protein CheD n=1 Tax=Methylomonas TaxID=416 RepID=UPI001232B989|nr:chemotaxis protein CheD [Methylomonas rhizoryzae]
MNTQFRKPESYIDIFLQPGEFYFGDRETRIRTLLGSCVAITMWHPRLQIGGMCHYLLPLRSLVKDSSDLDGRYASDAIMLFLQELDKSSTWPHDYEVKIFGGGDQFPSHQRHPTLSVPDKNITAGQSLLRQHGFTIKVAHLGGTGHRNVIFDVWSGYVWLQHVAMH